MSCRVNMHTSQDKLDEEHKFRKYSYVTLSGCTVMKLVKFRQI